MKFQELFRLAMKRDLPDLISYEEGNNFDLGSSGSKQVPGAIALGLPEWQWPRDPIPASDNSVTTLHCYHFLEHLSGEDAISFLQEAERVMIPNRSVMNFCMPYYSSPLAHHDLTHKSFWTEDNFRILFNTPYYKMTDHNWKLKVHFLLICGIVERNLALVGQLTKEE